jgi:hypothetical protein
MAPIAPPPQPMMLRRVTLPRYQMSSAHFSCFHYSVIESPPTGCGVQSKASAARSRFPARTKVSAIPRSLLAIDGLFAGKFPVSKLDIAGSFNRFYFAETVARPPPRVLLRRGSGLFSSPHGDKMCKKHPPNE